MADETKPTATAVPLTGICLDQDGHDILVLVERDGHWYEAIRRYMSPEFWREPPQQRCISGDELAALDDDSLVPRYDDTFVAPPWDIEEDA